MEAKGLTPGEAPEDALDAGAAPVPIGGITNPGNGLVAGALVEEVPGTADVPEPGAAPVPEGGMNKPE
jgi:hypothetical protein